MQLFLTIFLYLYYLLLDGYEVRNFSYISKESPKNAEKFVQELQKQMIAIEKHPEAYPPLSNFTNISNRYRFKIFMKSFKIVFKVLKKMLIFVGLLHTSQGNTAYQKLRKAKYDYAFCL